MDKVIISVATTGNRTSREQTPYVPVTPEEIAAAAVEAWREGASMVHLHIRDDQQKPTSDPTLWRLVMSLIRDAGCDVILNLSTSGGGGAFSMDDRLNSVRAAPEMASFDAGSVNLGQRVFLNPPDFLERMARLMKEVGVKPEIECFDTGMIDNAMRLVDQGLIAPPFWFQFVLGTKGGARATPKQLMHMVESIPPGSPWSVSAVDQHQLPFAVMAILMGGHARTGLEDNIHYREGELATSNAQLVARLVRIARECGREPASPEEARALLGLVPCAPPRTPGNGEGGF